jgi:glycosyltransferase involved in cell wall biosynthesis
MGNSQFHQHMFGLLARHPGVVVLHELFLSGAIQYCESALGRRWALPRALYASHGYAALVDDARRGREAAVWTYPCSGQAIDSSDGVIVHSRFIMRFADEWFGEGTSSDWRLVPLCRAPSQGVVERSGARQRLGLSDEDFLVCAFGILGPTKLNDRLLDAWLGSSLARDPRCRLAFVGGAPAGPYLDALVRRLEVEDPGGQVRITGFVSREVYEGYLASASLCVQLRAETRGETSAAVLDCLAHGLPTLVNAHGWATELPRDTVVMLPEDASAGRIRGAIERLREAPDERRALSERAAEYLATEHDPARAAALYRDAIEHFAECGHGGGYRRLLRSLGRIETVRSPERSDLIDVAVSIAANRPRPGSKQLLVDVTELARLDLRTGIQRVTRAVLKALVCAPPPGYRVEAVREQGGRYVYARRYTLGLLGIDEPFLDDEPIEAASGDVFLGLDLAYGPVRLAEQQLVALRDRGVRIVFVVYDLLPVIRADWFPDPIPEVHLEWLHRITGIADGVVCISRTVADELITWLGAEGPARETPLNVGFFHMGADLAESRPTTGLGLDAGAVLAAVRSRPTFLMVGTVEPRKGHGQALAAFELLWQRGVDVGLVVVGKEGWGDSSVMARLRTHPERGRKLAWLGDASDETLSRLYESCAALLAASEGEGFGLPLIEAAQHGLPALARDIPVFREVAGEHATYFSGSLPEDLAHAIVDWLALKDRDEVLRARDLPWLTWAQSAEQLVDCVLGENWLSAWPREAGE